jgi:hypothetical protein
LGAWRKLNKIRRDQAAMQELPHAQFQALFANANRDPKKGKPFTAEDFCIFNRKKDESELISADVAGVIMALRHEKLCPAILLNCWSQVLAAAPSGGKLPQIRALKSDDSKVWVIAPKWEGSNIRAFISVDGVIRGDVLVRDLDRQLLTYTIKIPPRNAAAWIEGDLLLLVSN